MFLKVTGNMMTQTIGIHVCDELSPAEPHVWDEGQEIITYSCQECGAERVEEAPAPAVHWWVYLVLTVLLFSSVAATVVLIIVLKRPKGKYHRR